MALKCDGTSRDFLQRRPKQQFQDPQLSVQRLPRQPQQQSHQLMARQTKMLLLPGSLKWQAWHIGTSQTPPKNETDNKVLGCCPIKQYVVVKIYVVAKKCGNFLNPFIGFWNCCDAHLSFFFLIISGKVYSP
jgi:hypothetical protein